MLNITNRFILPLLQRAAEKRAEKSVYRCKQCNYQMADTASYLFLIPAHFDEDHEESIHYYIRNARPIENTNQIPTGNRACRMSISQCQSCGYREVAVLDFLKVRDMELPKSGDIYPYEQFGDFFHHYKPE